MFITYTNLIKLITCNNLKYITKIYTLCFLAILIIIELILCFLDNFNNNWSFKY